MIGDDDEQQVRLVSRNVRKVATCDKRTGYGSTFFAILLSGTRSLSTVINRHNILLISGETGLTQEETEKFIILRLQRSMIRLSVEIIGGKMETSSSYAKKILAKLS